jgi:phosphohistidine phosphatase
MNLLVVRHAPAGDRNAWQAQRKDDFLRPLTADGRKKMREAARGLVRLVDAPQAIATSPLVRAKETADILARAFDVPAADELEALEPGQPPQALLGWIRARERQALAVVVGHEPHLGILVSWLLAGRARAFVQMKKGGACLLELGSRPGPGRAELLWLAVPAQLRRLGR